MHRALAGNEFLFVAVASEYGWSNLVGSTSPYTSHRAAPCANPLGQSTRRTVGSYPPTVRPDTGERASRRLDRVLQNRRKKEADPCRTPAPSFVLRTSPRQRSSWWPIILVNPPVDLAGTTASRQSTKYA